MVHIRFYIRIHLQRAEAMIHNLDIMKVSYKSSRSGEMRKVKTEGKCVAQNTTTTDNTTADCKHVRGRPRNPPVDALERVFWVHRREFHVPAAEILPHLRKQGDMGEGGEGGTHDI